MPVHSHCLKISVFLPLQWEQWSAYLEGYMLKAVLDWYPVSDIYIYVTMLHLSNFRATLDCDFWDLRHTSNSSDFNLSPELEVGQYPQ